MSAHDYAGKALTLTNAYRAEHGAAPLQLCQKLQAAASEYAKNLASRNLPLVPKPDVPHGQNLFQLHGLNETATALTDSFEQAINYWYESQKDYNGNGKTGLSFSQLVWKTTERMGAGVAQTVDRKRTIVVVFYDPAGNVEGKFSTNVSQKTSGGLVVLGHQGKLQDVGQFNESQTFDSNTQSSGSNTENFVQEYSFSSTTSTSTSSTSTSTTKNVDESHEESTLDDFGLGDKMTSSLRNIEISTGTSKPTVHSKSNCPGEVGTSVQSTALALHNEFRRRHGVPPLKLDQKLCQNAEIHAKSLLNGNKASATLGVTDVGQNVYQVTGSQSANKDAAAAVKLAVNKWYEHQGDYNWGAPLASKGYANLFSQIVWKSTEFLGVGVATREDLTIIVCLYSPRGNIANIQDYQDNVLPAK